MLMRKAFKYGGMMAAIAALEILVVVACGGQDARRVPAPQVDEALAPGAAPRSIVLAGGCFWGVQEVYEHLRGVRSATAGYAGGTADTANYDEVSTGTTGHAESVRIIYDPGQLTLGRILQVFFSVVANPTESNRQGPDVGSQYRTVIFYSNPNQARIARAYINQLDAAHVYPRAVVTELTPLSAARAFYPAEAYHQDYARLHPDSPYIRVYDLPKLAALKHLWPALSR